MTPPAYAVSAASASREHRGGDLESFDAAEFGVLVLDVDQHVGVDLLQRAEELGPERDVVALAEGDEVPGRVLRPFVGPLVAAEVGPRLVRRTAGGSCCPARRTARRCSVLTRTSLAAAWKTSGPSSRTTATGSICCQNRCEASSSTPTWVAPVSSISLRHVGGVEHQVLRVQLEGDLDVEIGGQGVGFLPERGGDLPLVVQHVQGGGVPGVDDPVRPGSRRARRRAARTW